MQQSSATQSLLVFWGLWKIVIKYIFTIKSIFTTGRNIGIYQVMLWDWRTYILLQNYNNDVTLNDYHLVQMDL